MTMLFQIVLSLILSFAIGTLLIPQIIHIAHSRNMYDAPDERKIHKVRIPRFGGIGIFFGTFITFLTLSFSSLTTGMQFLTGALLIIVIIGMRDDFLPLRAIWKLFGQIAAASLVIIGDFRLFSLHGFLGVGEINDMLSFAVSLYTIIVITNSFNLIDGIDGLAGTVSVAFFSFFGTWFAFYESPVMSLICFSAIGATLSFLRFNYTPSSIFMGDTGSLMLGFLASAVVLEFLRLNANLDTGNVLHFASPVSVVSAALVYPLFDTLRVFTIRVLNGRSPFSADKNHLHHLLLNAGFTHLQAVFLIITVNVLIMTSVILLEDWGDNILVPAVVAISAFLSLILQRVSERKLNAAEKSEKSVTDLAENG
jgi:UDP-N-acetylmuramyl pentapeptide phosphotransferase/UDP-N-acetylglucosamine-1-phosphate transferase